MSEVKAALLGVIIGGVISVSTTWLQGSMAEHKDFATEKHQKLELLMENAIKLNYCLVQKIRDTENEDNCGKDGTEFRLLALSGLYFPELKAEVVAYLGRVSSVEQKVSKCPAQSSAPEEKVKHLECIKAVLKEPAGGEELQKLADKAESLSKTLWR